MPVTVKSLEGVSRTFRPGDEILSIDGRPVRDQLDLLYNTAGEGRALFEIRKSDGRIVEKGVSLGRFRRTGLVFEEMRFKRCRSKCIFCFVDQMPRGLRSTLYFKDDDFRLSFLFGNYITLNDVSGRDIARIIEMHLSPLYISVHSVDPGIRERLFGKSLRRDILADIGKLAAAGITMHAQIVLVPGINDGPVMEETIRSLFDHYPAVRSVSVVPVGLTGHREGLEELRGVTPVEARRIIDTAAVLREEFMNRTPGERFVHLADELYLLSGRTIPEEEAYDGYPQLANGVGMCRTFVDRIKDDIERLRGTIRKNVRMTIVTGVLGAKFMRRYILPLVAEALPKLDIDIAVVRNRLFGRSVGVSGLLAGGDMMHTLNKREGTAECIVIPPNALNSDGLLIDDMRPREIGRAIGARVLVPKASFFERRIVRACAGD
jgi:putative radical SAM enzyme (TIGR03279 family)